MAGRRAEALRVPVPLTEDDETRPTRRSFSGRAPAVPAGAAEAARVDACCSPKQRGRPARLPARARPSAALQPPLAALHLPPDRSAGPGPPARLDPSDLVRSGSLHPSDQNPPTRHGGQAALCALLKKAERARPTSSCLPHPIATAPCPPSPPSALSDQSQPSAPSLKLPRSPSLPLSQLPLLPAPFSAMLLKNLLFGLAALSLSAPALASPAPMSPNEPSKTSLTKRALEIPVCVSTPSPSRAESILSKLIRLTSAGPLCATTTADGRPWNDRSHRHRRRRSRHRHRHLAQPAQHARPRRPDQRSCRRPAPEPPPHRRPDGHQEPRQRRCQPRRKGDCFAEHPWARFCRPE